MCALLLGYMTERQRPPKQSPLPPRRHGSQHSITASPLSSHKQALTQSSSPSPSLTHSPSAEFGDYDALMTLAESVVAYHICQVCCCCTVAQSIGGSIYPVTELSSASTCTCTCIVRGSTWYMYLYGCWQWLLVCDVIVMCPWSAHHTG